VRFCCTGLAAATVRDEHSREVLAPLLSRLDVERTADPVFALALPGSPEPLDLAAEGLAGDQPLAIVCVRRWQQNDATVTSVAAAVDRLADEHGVVVAFLPLGGPPDADVSTAIIRRARSTPLLLPEYPLTHAAQIIGRASLVIGMRLHALIIAAVAGVPFTAIPYDPKVDGLLADLRYPLPPLFRPGEKLPMRTLLERTDEAWTRRDELAAHLRAVVPEMRARAERNFDIVDNLVTSREP
jgi:polysaccharide pyruvyl transferase WcaK-like protein